MDGICVASDAGSESGVALAAVVAPVCAVDANVPCGILSQRNEAGSREAKDRSPPAAGGFACSESAAGASLDGVPAVEPAEPGSVAGMPALAASGEKELSGPPTDAGRAVPVETVAAAGDAGAPVVLTVPGSGVGRVVCAKEGEALACGSGAFARTGAVPAGVVADPEPCAGSGHSAVAVKLEPGVCLTALWPPVAALESNVCPAVLLFARVTMLAPEIGAAPLVPATVIRPERSESGGCVAVTVALAAAKSVPEPAETGAWFGGAAVPGGFGEAIERERGELGSGTTGAGEITGTTGLGDSAESEAVGLALAAELLDAVPPRGFPAWVAEGALLASEACSTSEKVATALRGVLPAPGCAALFPRSEVPVSTPAVGIVCDTSTMDSICPVHRKASRGPKKTARLRLCGSRKCHKNGGLKKGLKFF